MCVYLCVRVYLCVHVDLCVHICTPFHCLGGLLMLGQPWVEEDPGWGCRSMGPPLGDSLGDTVFASQVSSSGGHYFCFAVKQGQAAFVSSSCGRISPGF